MFEVARSEVLRLFRSTSRVWMLAAIVSCTSSLQAQTWTRLTNLNPAGGTGTMNLLTDGSVIMQGPSSPSNTFSKLTPDSAGNYIDGTFSNIASMAITRLYTGNIVMPNGKYFILGGEYSNAGGWTNTGEIYDPLTNLWTPTAPFPRGQFGDGQAVLLPNGKILAGYLSNTETFLYTPSTNTWAASGSKLRGDRNNEETWLLIPGGDVLCYEIFSSPASGAGFAQRYVSSTGTWIDAGSVPVPLSNVVTLGAELGPGAVLPDGRVIQIGANNLTAIYTPSTNSWVQGPSLPANMGADDTPGAMLPNGHFLFAADTSLPSLFTPPTKLYDFDYTTNSLTDVTPGGALGAALATRSAYVTRTLMLPNGHMLFNYGGSDVWDYNPGGPAPQAAWKPTIASVTKVGSTTYTLTGTRLTGISEGANYGDDAGQSTNYPIVRLTNSGGVVKYLRTFNWTPNVASAGDTTPVTVQFTLPAGTASGNYQLASIANGIASANFPVSISGGNIVPPIPPGPAQTVVVYNAGARALTITGDAVRNDQFTVTFSRGILKITGGQNCRINGGTSVSYTIASPTLPISLTCDLMGGADAMSLTGIKLSTANIQLGDDNDSLSVNYCVVDLLTLDGGTGTDAVIYPGSKFAQPSVVTNVP